MRYETKVKALSATLGLLVLALVLGWVFDPARRLQRAETSRLVKASKDAVAAIEIGGQEGVSLAKAGGSWAVFRGGERLPAEAGRVEAFLDAVYRVTRLSRVADSKSAWSGYGLDEAKVRRLLFKDSAGRELASIGVGQYGSTGREVYVRLGEAEASYAVDSGFVSYLGYQASGWLDLRVLPDLGGPDKVQAIFLEGSLPLDGGGKPARRFGWRLTRDQGGWKPARGAAQGAGAALAASVDAVAAESLLRSLLNLQAEDIVPGGADFGAVGATAGLELSDGRRLVLEVGAGAVDGRFLLRYGKAGDSAGAAPGAASERIWKVSSYALGNAFKELSALAAKAK